MIIDIHNHLIPSVDDGAQSDDEARAALERFVAEGVGAAICTPHLDASMTRQPAELAAYLGEIDTGFQRLEELRDEVAPEFELHRAVELKLDLPDPDLSDPRLRVGGGKFLIVEFPFMNVPPFSEHLISGLRMQGWFPVLVHPERYAGLDRDLELAYEWRRVGAYLQVNGGSILGRYGQEARSRALGLLREGLVDYIASDYHSRGEPRIREYRAALVKLGDEELARTLMEINPARLLAGEPPLPVMGTGRKRSFLDRFRKVFR